MRNKYLWLGCTNHKHLVTDLNARCSTITNKSISMHKAVKPRKTHWQLFQFLTTRGVLHRLEHKVFVYPYGLRSGRNRRIPVAFRLERTACDFCETRIVSFADLQVVEFAISTTCSILINSTQKQLLICFSSSWNYYG